MAWINALFLKTLNMAVAASWLIAALLLLRPVLKRIAPQWLVCALWALVAIRLVLPAVPLHSGLSAYRLAGDAVQESGQVVYFSGYPDTDYTVAGYTPATLLPGGEALLSDDEAPLTSDVPSTPAATASLSAARDYHQGLFSALWAFGVLAMLVMALVSYARVRNSVSASVPLEPNVYLCDDIPSPFILGVLRPRIYLSSGMEEAAREYVLRHERAHLRRGDHIWKPLGFLLLAAYWYDPLVWVAYFCFCRDMELACDERVIRTMVAGERANYSQTLLDCACGRRWVTACPLAFGEVGVKTRIKSVLHYKKPAFWAMLMAVLLCIVVAVCFLTDPLAAADADDTDRPMSASFGHYGQDIDPDNEQEPIQWRVLDRRDGELLLISQYALDFQSYTPLYESTDPVGWQDSSLRQWLNSEFLNAAFTAEEQQLIADTEITLSDTETVRDKVFLLTPEQVAAYMPTAEDAMASPTHYAQTRLPDYNTEPDTATCTWWLLSSNNGHAGVVLQNGSVNAMHSYEPAYVRPAIWVQADAVESSLIPLETILGADSDSARNVLLPAMRNPVDVILTGVAESSGGTDLDTLIDSHDWVMQPSDAQPTGATPAITLYARSGDALHAESGMDALLWVNADGDAAAYASDLTGDEIVDALSGWAWRVKKGISRSRELVPDAETFFTRFINGDFRGDIYAAQEFGGDQMPFFTLMDMLTDYVSSHTLTDEQYRILMLNTDGLDGAYASGYGYVLEQAYQRDPETYLRVWNTLTYDQQKAIPWGEEGILPRPAELRWSYDAAALDAPYMTVNGGGTVFYMEVPNELAQRIRQRVAENVPLSGFTAPQFTNGWGRDLISWSAEKAEVHLVFAEDYSEFYALCRGEGSVWGLDTQNGAIQADSEVRELLAMIAALTGWKTDNGREAFSGLTMAELIYNGKTLLTVTDSQRLSSLQNLLQNGTQASYASKTPMERVELRMTRSDGTTVSVLLDTDSPRIFLPPFYYYEYNDYESTDTLPLLEVLGLNAWPEETGNMDCSTWLNKLLAELVPLSDGNA